MKSHPGTPDLLADARAEWAGSIEIFAGENGGHRVVDNFKREAGKKEGAMGGGVYMERPKPGHCWVERF